MSSNAWCGRTLLYTLVDQSITQLLQ